LARLDPNTEKIEVFSPPSGLPSVGDFLDWDGKGNIWVAAGGGESRLGMLRFEPKTQKFTFYKSDIGEGTDAGHAGIYGVTADSEGNGWSSRYSSDLESKADYETGKIEEVQLPKRPDDGLFTDTERKVFAMEGESGFFWGVPWGQGPRRPGGDKHGDSVWVPGWWSHNLMKIDIHTSKVVKEYPMPLADGGSYMAQVDKDHVVWVNYQNSGTISKFDPKTEKWTVYTLPSLGLETHQIGVYDHDGPTQIAVADERNSKIDRVQFRTQAEVSALRAVVQETASNR
jgi:streptogramin lyase